jgi:chemotaxis protein CheZ
MSRAQKPYRIETLMHGDRSQPARKPLDETGSRHAELMAEFAKLRALMKPAAEISAETIETFRREIGEAAKLKSEMDLIREAIQNTKQEIATLHGTSFETAQMARVSGELDAVVAGTEAATESILASAEFIDDHAMQLAAHVKTERDRTLASEIQEKVVSIFEACNFQDLTGQRITKVITTLNFVEQHIDRMIEIWGGIEQFHGIEPNRPPAPSGDKALLNGPALPTDEGRASQDDIDALFG